MGSPLQDILTFRSDNILHDVSLIRYIGYNALAVTYLLYSTDVYKLVEQFD